MFGKKLTRECQELILSYAGGTIPPGVSAQDWKTVLRQWAAERGLKEAKDPEHIRAAITKHNNSLSSHPRPWQMGGQNGRQWLYREIHLTADVAAALPANLLFDMERRTRRGNMNIRCTIVEIKPSCFRHTHGHASFWCKYSDVLYARVEVPTYISYTWGD